MATRRHFDNLSRILRAQDYRDDVPQLHNKSPAGNNKLPILTPVMIQKHFSDIVGVTGIDRDDTRKLYEKITTDFVDGRAIYTVDAVVGSEFNIVEKTHTGSSFGSIIYDVKAGEKFFINAIGGNNPLSVCILDDDDIVLYVGTSKFKGLYTIPATGTTMIINSKKSDFELIKIFTKE